MENSERQEFLNWVTAAYGESLSEECAKLWPLETSAVNVNEDRIMAEAMHVVSQKRYGDVDIAASLCESDYFEGNDN